ncbi:MAG: S41 family peptidase [Candidatus Promineifilaceae bacterium]|nr:S41 family peptidase [Candidatus Promineifilaceae bacterium]
MERNHYRLISHTTRSLLLVFLVVLMGATAFAAGYVTSSYLRLNPQTVQAAPEASDEEIFSLFWEAWGWVEQSYLGELPSMRQVTYGAIRGALSTVGDPYTIFVEPPAREQEREVLRGNFGGVGANLFRNESGEIVLEPIPGNPAERAGILSGDVLLAVDGVVIVESMTVDAVAEMIRGDKGTTVVLTVRHSGTLQPIELEVVRDEILIPSVSARILREAPTVGYIQLTRFSGESSSEIAVAIEQLRQEGATALILDLRGNGGGLLDAAVEIADHFLVGGPVLYQESRGEDERVYEATDETLAPDIPLIVLVDGGTASAAEILAGALRDRQRALLVGSQTFGKGSVQLVYDLSDGSSVHVTASRWLTPARNQIDQHGLTPDTPVESADNDRDLVLQRAIESLQE